MKAFKQQQMLRSIPATRSLRRSTLYVKRSTKPQYKKDNSLVFEKTKYG
jgi:hypothetical protein